MDRLANLNCVGYFCRWFVIVMALGGVANHVLSPNAGKGMGYLAIAAQFGFAFAFPVSTVQAEATAVVLTALQLATVMHDG